jgi:hypothetical protein
MQSRSNLRMISLTVLLFTLLVAPHAAFAQMGGDDDDDAPTPTPAPGSTLVTVYSAPAERDFGRVASENVSWHMHDSPIYHVSKFVPGFAGRDSIDPKYENLGGVAMEGSGFIDPKLHQNDIPLTLMMKAGYTSLSLETWDEVHHKADFSLSKYPLSTLGTPLVAGVSAAVKLNNLKFPLKRWIRIDEFKGRFVGYRHIDDECSSCEENHIDLYEHQEKTNGEGSRYLMVKLMPTGFVPPKP